jgi:hypothetical protein
MLTRVSQWLIGNAQCIAFTLYSSVVIAGFSGVGPGADPLLLLIWAFLAVAFFFGPDGKQSTADR